MDSRYPRWKGTGPDGSTFEVPVEPLDHDLEPLHTVHGAAGPRELVRLGRKTDHLDRAPQQAQRDEQVLALLDGTAQVLLRVQDEEGRVDVLRVGRRRDLEVRVDVLEQEL